MKYFLFFRMIIMTDKIILVVSFGTSYNNNRALLVLLITITVLLPLELSKRTLMKHFLIMK